QGNTIRLIGVNQDITERKLMETALRESEAEFRTLAESMPQIVWITRPDGWNIYFNQHWMDYTGLSLEESLGHGWKKPFHPDDQQRAWDAWQHAMATTGTYSIESRLRRADGVYRWWLVRGVPLQDANGNILKWFGTCTDIHDLKMAELEIAHTNQVLRESERRFIDLLGNVELISMMLDREARITFCNDYLLRLTGWQREEIVGRDWFDVFIPPEIGDLKGSFFPALLANLPNTWHHENEILTRSGERRLIYWNNSVLRSEAGEVIGTASIGEDITERKQAADALRESEAELRAIFDGSLDGILVADMENRQFLTANAAICRMLGYTHEEILRIGVSDIHPKQDLPLVAAHFERILHGNETLAEGIPMLRKDGSVFYADINASPLCLDGKDCIVGMFRDITERKAAETRIVYLNRVHAMLSGINTLLVRVQDRDELFSEACRIAVEAGGFRMALIGMVDQSTLKMVPVASAGKNDELVSAIKDLLASSEHAPNTIVARVIREKMAVVANDAQNDPRVLLVKEYAESGIRSIAVLPLLVADEALGALALYASDIDFFHAEEMKLLTELASDIAFAIDHLDKQERLNYLAYYDVLTGLPNRTLLRDRLEQGIKAAQRNATVLAALSVDLNNFKAVLNSFGHSIGDLLLQEVARRLAACLRATDTLGYLDGDAFGIVLPEVGSGEDVAKLALKLIEHCRQPYLIRDHELFVSASVGIALFPDDAIDCETLFRNADTALYRAKALGHGTYQFFTAQMNQNTQDKIRLEADLRIALAKGEFLVYYQPKVSCSTGKVTGFEALLRWQHPTRGLVEPNDFIPALEDNGLIVAVGAWVLNNACAQARRWHDDWLGTPSIAVNISGQQIKASDLYETVRVALTVSKLAPAYLELELTESQLMEDAEGIIGLLRRLKTMGITLSIDDFGTGYSSLAYLKRFPIDCLKVDRAFVRDIIADPNDVSITRAIITLAHSLKLKVVAEGVETEGQLGMLIANHCDEIQGFFFSRPLPAEEATALLRAGRTLDSMMMSGMKRSRSLLLVDDEEGVLSSLKRLLRPDGYNILTASSAEQGLELLASRAVDVIVSDQRMPGMSGVDFLRRVKILHPETVRLVLSGYTDLQTVTDAINEGAIYKFLTKPWDDNLLRATIKEAFRNKEKADEKSCLQSEAADLSQHES
ncbi:MAG: diguanylate cyclase protein, partial [Proteobacteria bacterium]|nr:diguanylate cyclase protein [Pseudomonadota bacterium]